MNRTLLFNPWLRQLLAALVLCFSLIILFRLTPQLTSEKILKTDDFVEYWAAGRLNLTGGNPYNPAELLPLQLQAGRLDGVPVMMWNPPWIMPLVMPFGALAYSFSRLLWLLSHTIIIIFCASYLWRYYHGSPTHIWLAWLISLIFLPTLFLLKTGQIPTVLLLGAVLYLMWTERHDWWLLSLSILLITIKPHTLYLVIIAFFFWAVDNRRLDVLLKSGLGLVMGLCLSLIMNPQVLHQYFYAISHYPPSDWATPTIGGTLRYFLGVNQVWLQFLPTFLGLIWFYFYWRKVRLTWKWSEQLPVLITVSVLTASYGWTCDYVILLLPILSVATELLRPPIKWTAYLSFFLFVTIEAIAFAAHGNSNDFWYMWLAPALAGWYFLSVRLLVRLNVKPA